MSFALENFPALTRMNVTDWQPCTTMIEDGQSVMCDNKKLYEEAMSQYVKYRSSKYAQENDPRLIAERKAREEEERKKAVAVKLETLTQHEARIIGCENLCNSSMRMLDIRKYLISRGWKRDHINFALMQIIARAIYPYSELNTVRYLRENTALAEMFGIPKEKITKDALYESAKRLWDEHRGLEDWLHDRVCSSASRRKSFSLTSQTPTLRGKWRTVNSVCMVVPKRKGTTARLLSLLQ